MRVRVVVYQGKILEFKTENVPNLRIQDHFRKRPGFPAQLQFYLLHVVVVDMGIPKRMDEFARLVPTNLGHHQSEQSVGGNVERHP